MAQATVPSIYHAIFQMSSKDKASYIKAWYQQYPDGDDDWMLYVNSYTVQPYMLFCAPLTPALTSFIDLICRSNNLELIKWDTIKREPVELCVSCDTPVTYRVDGECLECYQKSYTLRP